MRSAEDVRPQANRIGLTRLEAAHALGVSPVTVDRLAKRGLLRPSRATRRPIYWVQEIERFLQETTVADFQPQGRP